MNIKYVYDVKKLIHTHLDSLKERAPRSTSSAIQNAKEDEGPNYNVLDSSYFIVSSP